VATHFEKADKLIGQAESKRNDDPKTCVSLLLKARAHLDLISPSEIQALTAEINSLRADDVYSSYGWYYQYSLMALQQLGELKEAAALAQDCVNKIASFEIDKSVFYHQALNQIRYALRRAHIILAQSYLRETNISLAIHHLKTCLDIKWGDSEYEDPFLYFYEPAAQIYLAAYESQPKKYKLTFYKALCKLQEKAKKESHAIKVEDPRLLNFLRDADYLQFASAKPIEKIRKGNPTEIWQAALQRFQQAHRLLKLSPKKKSEVDWNQLTIKPPTNETALALLEQEIKCALPESLRLLLLNHGAFEMRSRDAWQSLRLYDCFKNNQMPTIGGLESVIDELWGGRPEFTDSFTKNDLVFLNAHYTVFGHYFVNDNAYYHLYFTPQGSFGSIFYDQDDWSEMEAKLKLLLTEADKNHTTLDGMISHFTNMAIEALIEQRNKLDLETR
jgi:hypothetical protein